MTKEFNLSREMMRDSENVDIFLKGSVKKFILKLKEAMTVEGNKDLTLSPEGITNANHKIIDKLAGEKLI